MFLQRQVAELKPVAGEKMIVKNISNNTGESPVGLGEVISRTQIGRVLIGERVDTTVPEDACAHTLRIVIKVGAANEISTILANQNKLISIGEQTVGEIIQACRILLTVKNELMRYNLQHQSSRKTKRQR